jgi:hypothetical protein
MSGPRCMISTCYAPERAERRTERRSNVGIVVALNSEERRTETNVSMALATSNPQTARLVQARGVVSPVRSRAEGNVGASPITRRPRRSPRF